MAQDLMLECRGLFTNVSDLTGAPRGALRQAMNIDISKDNIAQPRRGSDLLTALPDPSYRAGKLYDYQDYVYAWVNSTLYNYVSGSWVSRGALLANNNALVPRGVLAANNFYVTTGLGLKKTDLYTTSIYLAGLAKVLSQSLTESTATGTAVATGKTVNYRSMLVRKDANNNTVQGPVCSGQTYSNSSGATKDVTVMIFLPTGLDGRETVQVYRSVGLTSPAVTDECQQVYEYPLGASNIAATAKNFATTDVNTGLDRIDFAAAHGFAEGSIVRFTTTGTLPTGLSLATDYVLYNVNDLNFQMKTTAGVTVNLTSTGTGTHTVTSRVGFAFFDIVPDGLLGATIYTAPSQNGISQNNAQAPLAADIALYRNFLFFADTQAKQIFAFNIISCGGTGLVVSDTVTIGSETYTAGSAASYGSGSGTFVVDTASGSIATRVDNTARSLVDVINQSSLLYNATLVYTDSNSIPGRIQLEAKLLSASAFLVGSSKASAFYPLLVSGGSDISTSSADTFRNGLMYSRDGLPEAVPPLNIYRVGSADDPIARIVALRDALLIFKKKDGAYVLRGTSPGNFSIDVLDATARIVAPESLAVVNGSAYGLFEAGVCKITDTAVEVISDGVKDKIDYIFGTALQETIDYSVGINYEQDNKYILGLPTNSDSTYADYQLVYDIARGGFTEWNIPIMAGFVFPFSKKLYIARADIEYVMVERKNFDASDFADYLGTKTITSYSGYDIYISGGVDAFNVGDLLSQGVDESDVYVESVNVAGGYVTVDYARSWTTGTDDVDHYSGIEITLEWIPFVGDNPAGFKHFVETVFLFKQGIIGDAVAAYSSDVSPSRQEITITGAATSSAWGVGEWGIFPWGGESIPQPIRVAVPRNVARCNALSIIFEHRVAWSDWQLQGVTPLYLPISTKVAR